MKGHISKYHVPKRGQTILLLHEDYNMYYTVQDSASGQTLVQGFFSYNPETDQVKHLFQKKAVAQHMDLVLEELEAHFLMQPVSG